MISINLSLAIFGLCFCQGFAQSLWRRRNHAAIIANNWLYIDGGDVAYGANNVSSGWNRENTTSAMDLSKDWTNSTLSLVQTTRPREVEAMALSSASLWFDDKHNSIYCFGGFRSGATTSLLALKPPDDSIWGFKLNDQGTAEWNQVIGPLTNTPFPSNIHRIARGMTATDGNRAYYLGGFFSRETSLASSDTSDKNRVSSPGLLLFDFNTLTFTNSSDGGYITPLVRGKTDRPTGAMIHMPTYGDDGILGILPSGRDHQDFAFNNITLYDKKTQKWYSQTTSGDIPEPRTWFCAVGVGGDENNTFEIFLHGGFVNNAYDAQAPTSSQIYILSIPSFRWFQANYTSTDSRAGHTCHIKNNQIIMIGGQNPAYWNKLNEDPWLQGIGVFDMKSLRFKDSYQAKADAYETPDFIKQYYRTAGNQFPSSWTSTAVKELFEGKSESPSNTTNSTILSSTTPFSQPHQLGQGAVAGIAVGCVAFVVIVAAGATFKIKHKSKRSELFELSDRSPQLSSQMSPSESQCIELSARQPPKEMLTEHQDLAELPNSHKRRRFAEEPNSRVTMATELPV
ncbi:hypothetical protein MMC29_004865 [Sticta canariensis]|nr:hypothetical protein [Sticta canariensis]